MEQTRPKLVKSLLKGLGCLSLVNRDNGITVPDAATETKLPKSTVYRLLETLCRGGYAVRDTDGRYRCASRVRTLSHGFDEEEWVLNVAHPAIIALSRKLVWGVGLATPAGLHMHVRETTDRDSPLTIDRWKPGALLPLDSSGPGHLYLAHLSQPERSKCIDALMHEPVLPEGLLRRPIIFNAYLDNVRKRGFVIYQISDKEAAVSVPLLLHGRFIASIGMHYIWRALTDKMIEQDFVPALKATARKISACLMNAKYGVVQK